MSKNSGRIQRKISSIIFIFTLNSFAFSQLIMPDSCAGILNAIAAVNAFTFACELLTYFACSCLPVADATKYYCKIYFH